MGGFIGMTLKKMESMNTMTGFMSLKREEFTGSWELHQLSVTPLDGFLSPLFQVMWESLQGILFF